jgi:hypothetical protein
MDLALIDGSHNWPTVIVRRSEEIKAAGSNTSAR